MRIRDSLQDGVSFFMAELRRLKQIVDRASRLSVGSRTTLFFLLDEVLQGTNSVERHIAVSRVVQHLIQRNATGAISTHDLELAKSPKLTPHCQPVHFRESIVQDRDGQKMIFDYQMRPGLATTTNALKLLELVGIKES
jgi:DNA mismatch repair ATPase MutS